MTFLALFKQFFALFLPFLWRIGLDCVICGKCKNFKNPKISYIFERKTLLLSIICSKCENEHEKIFKEEESIEILKIPGLIKNI